MSKPALGGRLPRPSAQPGTSPAGQRRSCSRLGRVIETPHSSSTQCRAPPAARARSPAAPLPASRTAPAPAAPALIVRGGLLLKVGVGKSAPARRYGLASRSRLRGSMRLNHAARPAPATPTGASADQWPWWQPVAASCEHKRFAVAVQVRKRPPAAGRDRAKAQHIPREIRQHQQADSYAIGQADAGHAAGAQLAHKHHQANHSCGQHGVEPGEDRQRRQRAQADRGARACGRARQRIPPQRQRQQQPAVS